VLVNNYMTRHPFMAEPDMSIVEAQRYMGENNLSHLPVVGDGKRLLGLVTPETLLIDPGKLGSLNVWEISRYLSRLTVKDVMVPAKDVITIHEDATIEEAASLMIEKKIGCLPVLDGNIVVGLITDLDLMAQLTKMMSMEMTGVRATIRLPMRKGELAKLVSALAAQGWGIATLGGVVAPKDPSKWEAVVKVRHVSIEELIEVLQGVEDLELVDIRKA
jgi:acetoin utilization protein AcuB